MFPYEWHLSNANFAKDKGKVFTTFACGGGSSMGYKLAGYDVLGCNEIDPLMMGAYVRNHKPKYSFLEAIQSFKNRNDFPDELYNLDVYDGSPPCSSFSMAGNRDEDWGKEKIFREGQAEQVLDTLFFDYIELGKKLQPKVMVAENVKGLMMGEAIEYVKKIYAAFEDAGYNVQHWIFDSSVMGVPQRRERVFFIALRNDLCSPFLYQKDFFTQAPYIDLTFKEKPVKFGDIFEPGAEVNKFNKLAKSELIRYEYRQPGDRSLADCDMRYRGKSSFFNELFLYKDQISPTITATPIGRCILFDEPRKMSKRELCLAGSYPLDYDFGELDPGYLIGMSVPPVMVAQIAKQIYDQWLSKLN